MKTMRRWFGCCVLLLAAACGGDGGGPGSATLTGSFKVVGMESAAAPAPDSTAFWGSGESNGSLMSMLIGLNSNGVVFGPTPGSIGVSVDSDSTLHLLDPVSDEETHRGCVSGDGGAFIAGGVRSGDLPRLFMGTREWSTVATAADLSGSYHGVVFRYDGEAAAGSNSPSFDGLGSGTIPSGSPFNVDGIVGTSGINSPLTYSVAPDGLVTLGAGLGASAFQGGLHESGEFAVLAGSIAGGFQALFVLVEYATSASVSTFLGDYCVVGLTVDFATPAVTSFTGHLSADGTGNALMEGTTNEEGTIGTFGPTSASYSVAADGALTLTIAGETLIGGISQSGDFAVFAGPYSGGSHPRIYVLIR